MLAWTDANLIWRIYWLRRSGILDASSTTRRIRSLRRVSSTVIMGSSIVRRCGRFFWSTLISANAAFLLSAGLGEKYLQFCISNEELNEAYWEERADYCVFVKDIKRGGAVKTVIDREDWYSEVPTGARSCKRGSSWFWRSSWRAGRVSSGADFERSVELPRPVHRWLGWGGFEEPVCLFVGGR